MTQDLFSSNSLVNNQILKNQITEWRSKHPNYCESDVPSRRADATRTDRGCGVLDISAAVRWVDGLKRATTRIVQGSSILTRLVLSQAIVTVLVALRSEPYSTFVAACVCASVWSVVEVVVYQWYLTKHYGAGLDVVSRVPGLPVANKGLLAIY
jgi:hypothetical protein